MRPGGGGSFRGQQEAASGVCVSGRIDVGWRVNNGGWRLTDGGWWVTGSSAGGGVL